MSNLFLVEHQSQVEDFIGRRMMDQGHWIALGPSAMWALEQQGIAYQIPEAFYNAQELENLCLKLHERVEWLCHRLGESIFERSPELKEWGMRPFLFHIFPLTVLFDVLASRVFQLRSILAAYPKATAWAHLDSHHPWGTAAITFANRETLWGHLFALPGWNYRVELIPQPQPPLSHRGGFLLRLWQGKDRTTQKLGVFIQRKFILKNMASSIRHRDWRGLPDLVRQGDALLVHNSPIEWAHALPLLRDNGWRILSTGDQFFNADIREGEEPSALGHLLEEDAEIRACFECCGISFYPLFQSRLEWVWQIAPELCRQVMAKMRKLVEGHKIRAVLNATDGSFLSHAVSQAARYLGIPVIKWQHGFVAHKDRITQLGEFNDLMTSDVLLAYGEDVEKAYRRYTDKFPSKVVSVGAGSLDRIRRRENPYQPKHGGSGARRILYVTTNYYENNWYCGFSPPFNDRHLYSDQFLIMKSLRRFAQAPEYRAEVAVKLYPGNLYQDPPWVEAFSNIEGLRMTKESPTFVELLPESDIVVIDSPTTTVLQATATRKPLFVLMRHIGYPEQAKKMLEKRAVCAANAQNLMEALESYLRTGVYPASVDDNEFLRAYGNHLDDGRSCERAGAEVLKATRRSERA